MDLRVKVLKFVQEHRKEILIVGLLIIIPFLLFTKVHHFDFVNWDDDLYVYENPSIRSITLTHLGEWFTKLYATLYVPIPVASYAVDFMFYGYHPGGYHITNLLIHIANVLLLFFLFKRIFHNPLLAFGGALLFAIHPIQVDSMAWISQRKNLLCTFFLLAGFNVFVRFHDEEQQGPRSIAVVVFLIIAATLSKITATVAPLLLIAYDFFYSRALSRPKVIAYSGLILLSLILGILTLSFYPIILNYFTHGASIPDYIARQTPYLAAYFKFVFFPENIHFYYSFPPLRQVFGSPFEFQAFAFIGGLELLAMIYALLRRKKAGFWILWFFIFIAPVIVLPIPLGTQHLYLAMIGQIGLALCLLGPLKRPGLIILLGLAMILSPLAYSRLSLWENTETLWKNLLPVQALDQKQLWWLAGHDPNRIPLRKTMKKALTNLAYYYENNGQSDKAAMLYDTLTKFMPKFREAYTNLATLYLSSSDPDGIRKAEEVVTRYHAKNPGATPLYSVLASIAHRKEDVDHEIKYLQQALDTGEKNSGVYFNLGLTHARKRDFEKAVAYFKQGVAIDEHLPEIRFYLGLTLMRTEKWQEALQIFKTMLREKMEVEGIYFQMGYAYLKLNNRPQARKMYLRSIAKQPQISQAYYHLGLMAIQDGQLHQAKSYLEQAIEKQPDSPIYRIQLSKITEMLTEQSRSTTQASR